jgi:hypothetical protein
MSSHSSFNRGRNRCTAKREKAFRGDNLKVCIRDTMKSIGLVVPTNRKEKSPKVTERATMAKPNQKLEANRTRGPSERRGISEGFLCPGKSRLAQRNPIPRRKKGIEALRSKRGENRPRTHRMR